MTNYSETFINAPGATSTRLYGINNKGEIIGLAYGSTDYGFTDTNGDFAQLSFIPKSINNLGQIVGEPFDYYSVAVYTRDEGINDQGVIVGFTNTVTQVNYPPGAVTFGPNIPFGVPEVPNSYPGSTIPTGINNAGQIVGEYESVRSNGLLEINGFIYSNGQFTTLDDPLESTDYSGIPYTEILGINNNGEMVGDYNDAYGDPISFVYTGYTDNDLSGGTYTTILYGASLYGVNDAGQIVGWTSNGQGVLLSPATLFTTGADYVDFNETAPDGLTADQQAAIAGGADIYHGLGGNDTVTLPNEANYQESVGNGKTLGWTDTATSTFYTGSQPGDDYTVKGGDGSYFVQEGTGTETVTINGDGSNTITAGSGEDTVAITGNGANNITIGYGTDEVTITGTGANTISAGTSSAGITITNFSGSLTGSAPSPSPGATVKLSGADTGDVTIGSSSTLELQAGSSLRGTITFGSASGGTLKIDGATMPTNVISEFVTGDEIDLMDVSPAMLNNATVTQSAALEQFNFNGTMFNFNLSGAGTPDLAFSSDDAGGTEFTVTNPDTADANSSVNTLLDATQTFLKAVNATQGIAGGLTPEEFNTVFDPLFTALGTGADATNIYSNYETVVSSPDATPEQIKNAFDTATVAAFDAGFKTIFKGLIVSAGAEAAAAAGTQAVLAFAAQGTLGTFAAGLAIDAALISAPVVIGVGAAFVAGLAFDSYYEAHWKTPVDQWIKQNVLPTVDNALGLPETQTTIGVSLDGYISGATVFADANGTGKLAANDVSTTTDTNGNFTLSGGTGRLL